MKFNLKLTDKNNPLKVKIEEGVEAENEQALMFMYDTLGYHVQVLNKEGQSVANPEFEKLINTPAQSSIIQNKPTVQAKPLITTINGMKIKIVGTTFYKLDWVDLTEGEYRIHPESIRLLDYKVNSEGLKYQKLDWIEIKNEEEPVSDPTEPNIKTQ